MEALCIHLPLLTPILTAHSANVLLMLHCASKASSCPRHSPRQTSLRGSQGQPKGLETENNQALLRPAEYTVGIKDIPKPAEAETTEQRRKVKSSGVHPSHNTVTIFVNSVVFSIFHKVV